MAEPIPDRSGAAPEPPTRAARRITIEWDDGSKHSFLRHAGAHEWDLLHKPPRTPEIQTAETGRILRVTGYDQFQLVRVIVNCVDGLA